jgi:hypothetical protein
LWKKPNNAFLFGVTAIFKQASKNLQTHHKKVLLDSNNNAAYWGNRLTRN